jgi:hypothetical protein
MAGNTMHGYFIKTSFLVVMAISTMGLADEPHAEVPTNQLEEILRLTPPNYVANYPKTKAGEGTCFGICTLVVGCSCASQENTTKTVEDIAHYLAYQLYKKFPSGEFQPITNRLTLPGTVKLEDGREVPFHSEEAVTEIASAIHNYFMPKASGETVRGPHYSRKAAEPSTVMKRFIDFVRQHPETFLTDREPEEKPDTYPNALKRLFARHGVPVANLPGQEKPFITPRVLPLVVIRTNRDTDEAESGHAVVLLDDGKDDFKVLDPNDPAHTPRPVRFSFSDRKDGSSPKLTPFILSTGSKTLGMEYEYPGADGKMLVQHWSRVTPGFVLRYLVTKSQGLSGDDIIPFILSREDLEPRRE